MALTAKPFAGISYTDADWRDLWNDLFDNGVLRYYLGSLAVTGGVSPLQVDTGTAIIQGVIVRNTTAVNVTVSTPAANTGGRIIVKINFTAKTVTIEAKMSASGVTTAPSLQQDTSIYEFSLATFIILTNGNISTLTDTRTYAKFRTQIDTNNIIDGTISDNDLADNAVITSKLANLAVTTAKIADTNVTTGKIANNAVDNTKIGNNVPTIVNRQGGNSANWSTEGNTNYSVNAQVKIQAGVKQCDFPGGGTTTNVQVTFPTAFTQAPIVFITIKDSANNVIRSFVTAVTTTTFQIGLALQSNALTSTNVNWFAIGQ